jgi:hypothetical protein
LTPRTDQDFLRATGLAVVSKPALSVPNSKFDLEQAAQESRTRDDRDTSSNQFMKMLYSHGVGEPHLRQVEAGVWSRRLRFIASGS